MEKQDLNSELNEDNFKQLIGFENFTKYMMMLTNYLDNMNENESACLFLEMTRILQNLLCVARAGLWNLYFETARDIIP